MEFKDFNHKLQNHFKELIKDVDYLFETNINKEEVWDMYLNGFAEENNQIFRQRREMDCSCCRHFVKNMGNLVAIKDGVVHTMWDFNAGDTKYQTVIDKLDAHIKKTPIASVWVNKFSRIGTETTYERLDSGEMLTWNHFSLDIPSKFNFSNKRESEAEIRGELGTTRSVFKRSLDELTIDSIETVLELIAQRSLSKGEEWKGVLKTFLDLKKIYETISTEEARRLFSWEMSVRVGGAVSRIRNSSMGTLLLDLSENVELNEAVRKYEKIVDPANYKHSKTVYTQRMLDDAAKLVKEEGYEDSLGRRHAQLSDITVNNVLFSNKDSVKQMNGGMNVFAEMSANIPTNSKKFERVEEVSVDDFLEKILPKAHEVEVFLENKHMAHMVSLIAPTTPDAKSMLKWDNNFSWAYEGNLAGTSMRDNVKAAGGNVEGVLRFSIQWNDGEEHDQNDLDAHVIEPNGNRIYYGNTRNHNTGGHLDVDIRHPNKGIPAVENITWANKNRMHTGKYEFIVNNYANRGGHGGFKAEIEADGEIYQFEYNNSLRTGENVVVAVVEFDGTSFKVTTKLPSTTSSRDVWNLKTNQFVPVSVVSKSPNMWDGQSGIGTEHLFFFLKDCKNPNSVNGFFNEFLKEDLMKHRRVFQALGNKMIAQKVDEELSGIGFVYSQRNELIVKVKNSVERVVKVKF